MLQIKFLAFSVTLLFLSATTYGQSPDGFVKIAGGTTQISNLSLQVLPFSMSKTEVSNKEYRDFLAWLAKNRSEDETEAATPDLSDEQLKVLPKKYLKSAKYDNYPVVGVSFKAAEMYCSYMNAIHPELKGKFRLPDEREWIFASTVPNEAMLASEINATEVKLYNFRKTASRTAPEPVNSLNANKFGFFNMIGNVAEWTLTPGRVKGGSWNDTLETLNIKKPGAYNGQTEGSPYIGFRVVYFEEQAN